MLHFNVVDIHERPPMAMILLTGRFQTEKVADQSPQNGYFRDIFVES